MTTSTSVSYKYLLLVHTSHKMA